MNAPIGRLLSIALLSAAVLTGCKDPGTGPTESTQPTVTGTWTGRAVVNRDFAANFQLSLRQDVSGSISGSGTLETDDGAYAADITIGTGFSDFPSVSFSILNATGSDVLFSGTMDGAGARIEGRLSGAGAESVLLVLRRQ